MFQKFVALLTSTILLFSMTSCSTFESPETAVSNYLNALKENDAATVAKYIGEEIDETEETEEDRAFEDFRMQLWETASYHIISSEKNEDSATVTVSVSNIDMSKVLSEVIHDTFILASSGIYYNEALTEQIYISFLERIELHKDDIITKEVEVSLTKEEDHWIIDDSNELNDAFSGGLLTSFINIWRKPIF